MAPAHETKIISRCSMLDGRVTSELCVFLYVLFSYKNWSLASPEIGEGGLNNEGSPTGNGGLFR